MTDALLVSNGTILTMNPAQPEVEAFGVIGDRIVAAGNHRLVADALPRGYRTLDLGGRCALPGFNEAHNHMISYGLTLDQIDAGYPAVSSIADIVSAVRARAASTPPGRWIVGRGYDDNKLQERRHPTRQDLDRGTTAHPVLIVNGSGHLAAVNSLALQLAGITRDTDDPVGGHFVRDEHGEATGVLHETAQEAIRVLIPEPTVEDRIAALRRTNDAYVRAGITSSQDASSDSPDDIRAYQRAVKRGDLKLRTSMMIRENLLPRLIDLGIEPGFGDHRLRVGPIKLFIDGSLIGRTAGVMQPFLDDPREDNLGLMMMPKEQFEDYVMQAHTAGYQIAVHAIGDRGIDWVLDAYEKALTAMPRRDHRHRIEHCGICRPDILDRIQRLGVVPVSQPVFILEYGDGFIRHLGLWRVQLTYPFRSFLDRGIPLVFSSDCPVSDFRPLKSIQAAVTERTGSGQSYALEEAVTVEEALTMYTVAGAYATFEEDVKGQIKPGMVADFTILERDPRTVDPMSLMDLKVDATVIGGETVYEG
ncbi:MAG: amidohydrolase [Thermomicrobiales bacterium]